MTSTQSYHVHSGLAPRVGLRTATSSLRYNPQPLKQQRYPWGKLKEIKAVTISLGMLASDGIVLAADTQVSQVELKGCQGKIAMSVSRVASDPTKTRSFAITGAGNVPYLDALRKRMIGVFQTDAHNNDNLANLETALQTSLEEFYMKHVVPFDRYPPNERPDVWLIMAAQHGDQKLLWSTEKSLLVPQFQHATAGSGQFYADILLGSRYVELNTDLTALLAAYVTFQAKQHIDGCGQDTDIFILKKDAPRFIDRRKLRKLEEVFRDYSRVEAGLLLHAIGCDIDFDPRGTTVIEALAQTRETIKNLFGSKGSR